MFERAKFKLAAGARRIFMIKTVRRFRNRQDGAAAIEFGLVLAPFLALIFAIMETAGVFFAGQVLETATADSARLIMTGQAQTQGFSQEKFKEAVCSKIYALFDCNGGIYVDVKTYTTFSDITSNKPIDANGNLIKDFSYQPGGPGCIVVVRLLYEWPIYVSMMGLNLSDLNGKKRLLVASSAFRNEPYASSGSC